MASRFKSHKIIRGGTFVGQARLASGKGTKVPEVVLILVLGFLLSSILLIQMNEENLTRTKHMAGFAVITAFHGCASAIILSGYPYPIAR